VHTGTDPVPLTELLPDDLKHIFDSDTGDDDDDVEVVDVLPARLSTTAQPADDLIVSETEPESDEEVTVISVRPAPGPSRLSTMLPPEDLSLTEPESDEEDTMVSINYLIPLELTLIANRRNSWMRDRGLGSSVSSGSRRCFVGRFAPSIINYISCSSFCCSSRSSFVETLFLRRYVLSLRC
jgi:hypothetical protein